MWFRRCTVLNEVLTARPHAYDFEKGINVGCVSSMCSTERLEVKFSCNTCPVSSSGYTVVACCAVGSVRGLLIPTETSVMPSIHREMKLVQ